eukprot:10301-Heterococcus_DN1.PRE.1
MQTTAHLVVPYTAKQCTSRDSSQYYIAASTRPIAFAIVIELADAQHSLVSDNCAKTRDTEQQHWHVCCQRQHGNNAATRAGAVSTEVSHKNSSNCVV